MCDRPNKAHPVVLIVTKYGEFAATASRQLTVHDYTVRTLLPEEGSQAIAPGDRHPLVALVDLDAVTAQGSPLYQSIHTALPNCQIVLISTLDHASTAARLVQSAAVWDYLLIDSVRDANRLPLLAKRAHAVAPTSEEDKELQFQEILRTLTELRDILKGGTNNPVTEVLDRFKVDDDSRLASEPVLQDLARGYENCLVELICGRLRRLENQMLLLANGKMQETTEVASDRILVVEDDPVCGELAKSILEKNGFEVTLADTALDAREALDKCPPALVLMDVHLGDASGIELVKFMRAGSTCSDVPVIVVTSDRMRGTLLEATGVNVQGYLLKPYEPDLLVEKVTDLLGSKYSSGT